MNTKKAPMTKSYKFVFYFVIFALFYSFIYTALVIKSNNYIATLYWTYVAWLMSNRNNAGLVKLLKIALWVQIIVFGSICLYLLFLDIESILFSEFRDPFKIVSILFNILLTYLLYVFFSKQISAKKTDKDIGFSDIEDASWAAAYQEFNISKDEAAWARAFAESEGDEAKAKAGYLKLRAEYFQKTKKNESDINGSDEHLTLNQIRSDSGETKSVKDSFNAKKGSVIGPVILYLSIGLILYFSLRSNSDSETVDASADSLSSDPKAILNSTDVVRDVSEVSSICYVYWNGKKWMIGKTEGDRFARLMYSRYGINLIELGIPVEMAKEFKIDEAPGSQFAGNSSYDSFIDETWGQITALCNIDFKND